MIDQRQIDSDAWYQLLETYVGDDDDGGGYWTSSDDSELYETIDQDGIEHEKLVASYDFASETVTFFVPFTGIHS